MLWLIHGKVVASRFHEAEDRAAQIVRTAEKEASTQAREAQLEAKDMIVQAKAELDKEMQGQRNEILALEKRLIQKEESLDRRMSNSDRRESEVQKREKTVAALEKAVEEKETEVARLAQERTKALEYASGMTADEAKEIITRSIQRITRDYVAEATISVVPLPSDGMKGRIIGREGRNIRALEAATGIDLVVDETPEAVLISGFDPLRREIAKVSLERLMADGRIHPTRIEEVVEKVKRDLDKMMLEEAEKVLFELGITSLHPEIVKLLGKLKFRTSYGQNNLYHAREAAYICGIMASELELDVKLSRRGALMHDMGKALSQEEEGPHAIIGADFAKKYGEEPRVVNAIAAHHEQVEPISPETVLVAAAESLSAARPGARRETVEAYIKRLEKLEKLAVDYKGVDKAYAIQAGREIRVIVKQDAITDVECAVLSRDLARKIEQELTYPGQIKVTVIRESRYTDIAK